MGYNPNFVQKGNKIVLKLPGGSDSGRSPIMDLMKNKMKTGMEDNLKATYNDFFKNMMKEKAERERKERENE